MKERTLPELKKEKYMEEIEEKSLHVFEENTYQGTTIDMICDDILISKRTFFNYFENKEGLFYEIMKTATDGYRDYAEKAIADYNPEEALKKSILHFATSARIRFYNVTRTFWAFTLIQDRFMELRNADDKCNLLLFKNVVAFQNRQFIFNDDEMLIIISGLIREVIAVSSKDDLEANTLKWIDNIIKVCTEPIS